MDGPMDVVRPTHLLGSPGQKDGTPTNRPSGIGLSSPGRIPMDYGHSGLNLPEGSHNGHIAIHRRLQFGPSSITLLETTRV